MPDGPHRTRRSSVLASLRMGSVCRMSGDEIGMSSDEIGMHVVMQMGGEYV